MKKKSLFLTTLLCTITCCAMLSFKNVEESEKKPNTFTEYYNIAFQRISPGSFEECSYESSLIQITVTNPNYWTTTPQSDCEYASDGDYLCSIGFDLETTADGGGDGQLTLQEAINAVWNYYSSHSSTLPTGVAYPTITEGNTTIYIYRKRDATVCQ